MRCYFIQKVPKDSNFVRIVTLINLLMSEFLHVCMCPLAACRTGVGYRSVEAFKCYYGSLLTPSFRRSTASSGRTIKYLRYDF